MYFFLWIWKTIGRLNKTCWMPVLFKLQLWTSLPFLYKRSTFSVLQCRMRRQHKKCIAGGKKGRFYYFHKLFCCEFWLSDCCNGVWTLGWCEIRSSVWICAYQSFCSTCSIKCYWTGFPCEMGSGVEPCMEGGCFKNITSWNQFQERSENCVCSHVFMCVKHCHCGASFF